MGDADRASDLAAVGRDLELRVTVDDAFDGTVRLLVDAQRFGCRMRALDLTAPDGGRATIRLMLNVPAGIDPIMLRSRFARHPTVVSLEIV